MSGALDGAGDGGGGGCIAGPEYGKKWVVVVDTVEVEESDGDGDDTPLSALITVPADADADADPRPIHPSPPSEQQDLDDHSIASSHTLSVDEREGLRAGSADDGRSGSGPQEVEEEDMSPRRRRRDAFGASCVSDLDLDSVYAAPGDEERDGLAIGSPAGASEGSSAGPSGGEGGEMLVGASSEPSVLATVRRLQSLDDASSSGSSAAVTGAPHATHRSQGSRLDANTPAVTNEGIRGFRTRLRHRPGVADFLRPFDNSHADRSQALNLDGGVATPDTATLAEVNGSLSDDEDRAPLSLQRTQSSKYRYKGKGKEAVCYDPHDMDHKSLASSTASVEPRRVRQRQEPGQPFGHQPESSRDAVATPPADEPMPTTSQPEPQPQPSSDPDPESRSRPIRAGPRDGTATARDPGHWSLQPREDAATNTAAEEATRMTIEWLRRSDAEGTSPVDRVEGRRREWEVRLRGPTA
ncbi:hypothetical protein LTR01_001467 [Friedmanniomyces endolithicus]|nr:hypothetical protein LTR01_001467 [Friedmanniomyces endolithicus]KAK0830889.1 hypothetical protein LTR73_003276 [Friedmanniomyces endolithicus]